MREAWGGVQLREPCATSGEKNNIYIEKSELSGRPSRRERATSDGRASATRPQSALGQEPPGESFPRVIWAVVWLAVGMLLVCVLFCVIFVLLGCVCLLVAGSLCARSSE